MNGCNETSRPVSGLREGTFRPFLKWVERPNRAGIPPGTATADIVVDGSFLGAPKTYSVSYSLAPAPCCEAGGDANGDKRVGIADITLMIARIFAGGPAPVCGPPNFLVLAA